VVERINRDVMRVMEMPDVQERYSRLGAEPMRMDPAQFAGFVRSEIEDAARIARAAGIQVH
jgi:tripartite-type tricarboxylate transporter receptor subunit TctC